MDPIVGFRAWGMRSGSSGLYGVYHNAHPWNIGVTMAECRAYISREHAPAHPAPDPECTCGLHARTTIEGLLQEYPNYPMSTRGRYNAGKYFEKYKTLIFGAVLMWGEVLRGELVIRAQYAQPICFTSIPHKQTTVADWDELAATVARAYSVPIVPWDSLEPYATEFGDKAK